ncbi:MAG TPA: glutamate--tRNA ligase [Rubricoccaceae bacterium]|jgi:glutamyl-tRNA synthetase
MPTRVRFAPSPTGLLHVGGLRTALYNVLLARNTGGTFVLRIEDTDQARFVEEAEADILDSLRWAGLAPDEGPGSGLPGDGPHAPYRQSERTPLYDAAARRLLDAGLAYVAFDTPEALDAMRERGEAYSAATRGAMDNSLTLPAAETARRIGAGEAHVVRLKVEPGRTLGHDDLVRGAVAFQTDGVDDQVLVKSDGLPTYHLANVVDDAAMEITHVVRGEEWLPSVPKHLLLYEALGLAPPRMAHLPLILAPSGGKLSKRNAEKMGIPVSVRQYREAGYEPEALVNFLALLGWNDGTDRERYTLAELAEAFSVERIHKAGAKFDLDKLNWLNAQTLRDLPAESIAERARPAVEAAVGPVEPERLAAAADLMRERLVFAHDLAASPYLFHDPEAYDEAGLKKRWKDDSARLMALYADRLDALDAFSVETAEAELRALAEAEGAGFGTVVHPARIAVTGVTVGAGLFETMAFLGQEACVRRLRRAADALD